MRLVRTYTILVLVATVRLRRRSISHFATRDDAWDDRHAEWAGPRGIPATFAGSGRASDRRADADTRSQGASARCGRNSRARQPVARESGAGAAKRGDLPGATVSLERALRIEPNNPLLWIEMGRLRMDQRNFAQAESMGRKALSMSIGDNRTQSAAWLLVADALRARGKNPESQEALERSKAVGHAIGPSLLPSSSGYLAAISHFIVYDG